MSAELLPLVAAVLEDESAADAHRQLQEALDRVKQLQAVQIVAVEENDNIGETICTVYASADFTEGKYGNNLNMWDLELVESSPAQRCLLADLHKLSIIVGGGIPVAYMNYRNPNCVPFYPRFYLDENDSQPVLCHIGFLSNGTQLHAIVHDWPRNAPLPNLDEISNDSCPEAWLEFKTVSFDARSMPMAMQNILPPAMADTINNEREVRKSTDESYSYAGFVDYVEACILRSDVPRIFPKEFYIGHMLTFLQDVAGITRRSEINDPIILDTAMAYAHGGWSRNALYTYFARNYGQDEE